MNAPSLTSLRVLIVDDDPVYRRIVTMALQRIGVGHCEVAGDLAIARSKLEREPFDAVTIDVVLRGESGLDLLKWVHANHKKLATILLTSGSQSQASKAVDALLLGASALIIKPNGASASAQLDKELSTVLGGVAREKGSSAAPIKTIAKSDRMTPGPRDVVAIGASTGGPPVLLDFLTALPADYATPILITQHMPALHVQHFADLLRERAHRKVKVPAPGELLQPGFVYVAPGNVHMIVRRTVEGVKLLHHDGPEEHHCRPAVDPMFRTVAVVCGERAIGVVMTGMGADGAAGAAVMHEAGAPILVQDRESSVVWGMPGATVAKGVADVVARPVELANWVVTLDSNYKQFNRRAI